MKLRYARGGVVAGIVAVLTLFGPPAATTAVPAGFQDEVVFSGLTIRPRSGLARRAGLRRREERDHQGLRQPRRHDADDLRRPPHKGRQLLGPRTARARARPGLPDQRRTSTCSTPTTRRSAGSAPRWGRWERLDPARPRPAPTTDGCVVSGRLSRLTAAGDAMTGAEQVLVEDWCQQFPSHSVGDLRSDRTARSMSAAATVRTSPTSTTASSGDQDPPRRIRAATPRGAAARDAADRRGRRAAQPRTSAPGGEPASSTARPARRPRYGRRAARQPAGRRARPERAADRRRRVAQSVPVRDPARHERALGRRRRLEHLGGDRPSSRRRRRTVCGLRLAVLRGRRRATRLSRAPGSTSARASTHAGSALPPVYTYNHAANVVTGDGCPTGAPRSAASP